MPHGKTITTYLIDGTLNGPRYVKFNETSHYLYILPREITTKLSTAENDYPEYNTPGFYILTGMENGKQKTYIGKSLNCKDRISNQDKKISWWDTAYVFVSKTLGNLDATAIQYLEAESVKEANSTLDSEDMSNAQKPKHPKLSKDQEATIKHYYEEAKMLLEFAGCKVFVKAETKEEATHFIKAPNKGVDAKGIYDPSTGKVTVLADSIIEPNFAPSYKYKERRKKHMEEAGCVIKNNMPVSTKNMQFDSPSAAACFVLGRPANGKDEWKDKEEKSINDLKK